MPYSQPETIKVYAKCDGRCCWLGERCPECKGSGLLRITAQGTYAEPLPEKKSYSWDESKYKFNRRDEAIEAAINEAVGED